MSSALPMPQRPLLRGWLHLLSAPVALVGAIVLWRSTTTMPGRVTATIFGACLFGLYVASSTYHVPNWSSRVRDILGRIDAAMIVLTIVGTFTPIAYHALDGAWRTSSLTVAWVVAAGAIVLIASPLRVPRWLHALSAIAIGWLAVVPFVRIAATLPATGNWLIVLGGVLYTVGAIAYIMRWPDPFPRWFGYHEIFHLLVVAASALHWVAIWRYVLPIGHA
ncbi:MAG TPA: hemolysin III family protein [Euzebyales bacterium]|nr:hemolysin III family protein [Euzebyales bacterium]